MRVRVGADKWVKHNVCHRQIVGLWPLIGAALHDHTHRSILADQTAQISCQVHACVSVQSLTYQLLPPRANRIPSAKVYAENEAGRVEPGQDSKRQRQEDHPHWPQEHLQQQTSTHASGQEANIYQHLFTAHACQAANVALKAYTESMPGWVGCQVDSTASHLCPFQEWQCAVPQEVEVVVVAQCHCIQRARYRG